MNLRFNVIICIIITVLMIGTAILIWANSTGKITIWGDGQENPLPEVTMGLAVNLQGTLTKNGNYYLVSGDKNYSYPIYIINSQDIKDYLEPLLDQKIKIYGSLGGETYNQLLALWIDGKTVIDEQGARLLLNNRFNNNLQTVLSSLTDNQKECVFNYVTNAEFEAYLSGIKTNLSVEKKDAIKKCLEAK